MARVVADEGRVIFRSSGERRQLGAVARRDQHILQVLELSRRQQRQSDKSEKERELENVTIIRCK